MGSRGPARTPTRLKLLRGETRPSRLNHQEPRPVGRLPRLPAEMAPAATTVWRAVLHAMAASGVITAADGPILRVYCEAVVRYEEAASLLAQMGPLIVAAGTGARRGELVRNPLHGVVRDNALLVRLLARDLGLTPAARTGLRGKPPRERDPFAEFFRDDLP
jgi:P27 family predicted phage terminase small subunit